MGMMGPGAFPPNMGMMAGPAMGGGMGPAMGGAAMGGMGAAGGIFPQSIGLQNPQLQSPARIRSVFVESWLWDTTNTSSAGKATIATKVPDTITSWVASAFAMNSVSGLGITDNPSKLQVFRPFFVSLNLPYSVVRGEQVVLQAIVFNYMSKDANVVVTLKKSMDFRNIGIDKKGLTTYTRADQKATVLVPAGQGKTVSFPVIPTGLGHKDITVEARTGAAADAVKRQLLVEPEGVEQTYNIPAMINLKSAKTFKWSTPVRLPKEAIKDSIRVEFSLIGDLLGPSISGLDKLVKMPHGCGEQTMLGFAPTVFVTNYLGKVGQLSKQLKTKSLGFMEKGYQRELTFQRDDGSFSAFGKRDDSGSMWLTAFVVKSFSQAKNYIFIDNELVERATNWIINRQKSDGSFPEPGRIIHKEMTSKAGSGNSLTAFVLIAMVEVKNYKMLSPAGEKKVTASANKARTFLEGQIDNSNDPYSLAILSYALQLAGSKKAPLVRSRLHNMAKNSGAQMHWEQPQPEPKKNSNRWHPPHNKAKAVNIEIAAYALLDYSTVNDVTGGLPVLKWISGQRNANGGFSSTQDTVMALQALAQFAAMYSSSTDMKVSVNDGSSTQDFTVNSKNSVILQQALLPSDVQTVSVSASGSGISLAQVTVTYNVEKMEQEPAFQATAVILKENLNAIQLEVCARWLLPGESGMAVKEIGIPTGFTADVEGLRAAKYSGIKRIESSDRKIVLYYDKIKGDTNNCVVIDAERTGLVAKTQPASVKVFDYYEPENEVIIFYSPKKLKDSNICDVCGSSCDTCSNRK